MLKKIGFVVLVFFALIGVLFSGVFAAMQFGFLNVRGTIAERNQFFGSVPKTTTSTECTDKDAKGNVVAICPWNQSSEWAVVREGLKKDAEIIKDVSNKTGVSARMISASVVPEQLRFFTAERETFKRYFEPLKVLGSMSKFSLGISGIKQDTANLIERYTKDNNSPFYPGPGMDTLIPYTNSAAHDTELYNRLTDANNHYYSYLYTALYIKEIEAQWSKEGYDISVRPDVAVTLFNIGFSASKPKDAPQIGGSPIDLNSKTYSFGQLGTLYYYSNELVDLFPR
jgi:hypothetical protein